MSKKSTKMKSRYRLTVFPSKHGWISIHRILEASPKSLRLFVPTRLAYLAYILIAMATFLGPLIALAFLIGFFIQFLNPSIRIAIGLVPFVLLFVPSLLLSKLTSHLAIDFELRYTTRDLSRIRDVHVREIRTLGRGRSQLVRFDEDGKEEWVRVQATSGVLQEALRLSGQTVPAN